MMKIYLITVVVWFLIFMIMQGNDSQKEKGCGKHHIKLDPVKAGNVTGCLILASFWPAVLVGAILVCFIVYWRTNR